MEFSHCVSHKTHHRTKLIFHIYDKSKKKNSQSMDTNKSPSTLGISQVVLSCTEAVSNCSYKIKFYPIKDNNRLQHKILLKSN